MRIRCRGNVFTKPLPKNGSTRYNMYKFLYNLPQLSDTMRFPRFFSSMGIGQESYREMFQAVAVECGFTTQNYAAA
jgi:hypothetical protein